MKALRKGVEPPRPGVRSGRSGNRRAGRRPRGLEHCFAGIAMTTRAVRRGSTRSDLPWCRQRVRWPHSRKSASLRSLLQVDALDHEGAGPNDGLGKAGKGTEVEV